MCLSTGIKKLVAQRDITCYKVLKITGKDKYRTPYQETEVELNKELVTDNPTYEYKDDNGYSIGTGFIHALLWFNFEDLSSNFGGRDVVAFKATIPAGTEFFVNSALTQICARKMFVTDERVVKTVSWDGTPEWYLEAIKGAYVPECVDGVYTGDFCVAQEDGSKKYIRPTEYTKEIDKDIIGVVGLFKDDKPVVISRNEEIKEWCNLPWGSRPLIGENIYYEDVDNQMNGEELTTNILKHNSYTKDSYPVFDYISKFKTKGTKEGDWYIGAIGELRKLAKFTPLLNISLKMLEGADLLERWLWSSSEYNSNNAWPLSPSSGNVHNLNKNLSNRVRAFAVFAVAKD